MSSEGSITSNGTRIRQFGLYRSIDARTEEFLRLSRKRQIRQGCACAAISTAITVTVVVVVVFVYEFSLNSEVKVENSLKTNWFSLLNDTTGDRFETAFTKSNIDKTTLTLLPLLLKALKKNVFLKKILEDQSSSSPTYEKKDTTENSIDKNVFTKNWFRLPSSKLYAIAYKTSPITYINSHTKNLDYFTKIRKIRDYQRIIKYVDKMISEKAYIGSTKPMIKEDTFSERPSYGTIPLSNIKKQYSSKPAPPKFIASVNKVETNKNDDKSISCKCPKKIGELLHKIMSSIEMLLPAKTYLKKEEKSDCKHDETKKHNVKSRLISKTNENIVPVNKSYDRNSLKFKILEYYNKRLTDTVDHSHTKHITGYKYNKIESSTITINKPVKAFDNIKKSLTKPVTNVNTHKKLWNQKSILNFFKEKKSPVMLNDANEYDDYFATTIAFDGLKDQGVRQKSNKNHTKVYTTTKPKESEIVTETLISPNNNLLMNLNKAIYHLIEKNSNIQVKKKLTISTTDIPNTSEPPTTTAIYHNITKDYNNLKEETKPTESTIIIQTSTPSITLTVSRIYTEKTQFTPETTTTPNVIINTKSNKLRNIDSNENMQTSNEEESENMNMLTQDLLEPIKSPINLLNDAVRTNTSTVAQILWEDLYNENIPTWKSKSTPSHLEVQQRKNEWKHDEPDYDLNFNYDSIHDKR